MTLANQITLFRIALIPVFVVMFYLPYQWSYLSSAIVFTLAAATDWLDGYVARKYDQSTEFGAFLDPVADKLMVATALVVLVGAHGTPLLAVPAVVIVGREIIISALREWMAELGSRTSVAVSYVGKVKTTAQMVAIIILLAFNPESDPEMTIVGFVVLYIAAALTIWSMVIYLKAAWPTLMGNSSD